MNFKECYRSSNVP